MPGSGMRFVQDFVCNINNDCYSNNSMAVESGNTRSVHLHYSLVLESGNTTKPANMHDSLVLERSNNTKSANMYNSLVFESDNTTRSVNMHS